MLIRRLISLTVPVAAVVLLLAVAGCDWLKGTDSGIRLSPVLSSLSISPTSVDCEEEYTLSFHYDDPQGDVDKVTVSLEHSETGATITETPDWTEASGKRTGTASFDLSFTSCDSKKVGLWNVTVKVEDDRGHTSNELTGDITLNSK